MNLLRTVWLDKLHPIAKTNCFCSWVTLPVLLRRAVTSIHRPVISYFSGVWPKLCSARPLVFLVSWNRYHSLKAMLLTITTVSAVFWYVCLDSDLPIIRHGIDSGKSRSWDIFKSSFLKTNKLINKISQLLLWVLCNILISDIILTVVTYVMNFELQMKFPARL